MLVRLRNVNAPDILGRDGDGYTMNANGGFYKNGLKYATDVKMRVAHEYRKQSQDFTAIPNMFHIASTCGVSCGYVKKIEAELFRHGHIIDNNKVVATEKGTPGRTKLCAFDYWY